MKLALRLGWDSLFVMNEKQLAQLMPILETCHCVTDTYIEGTGRVYVYKDFKPDVDVLAPSTNIVTPEELEELKKGEGK